ncbi:MAG: dTDP-4-dehydrorhamnose reductase [Gammaproteobacteria bacterium]|nr:dTDP-4-dehydrorhamnose reductase [Gammaproteobacteria bacterium]MCW8922228.1 dTDP-4-dehydrorhamnose reductase [Gammaproteobacteria bacterium]
MKILLFGKNGQVGWELNRSLQPLGEVVALNREDADFSSPESLRQIISDVKPDVIVNAVAYTAVDKAEAEEELAATINSVAPGILAEEALKTKALLVHYSTDYVFDGTKKSPYSESDEPNPINVYGQTKLAGEQLIQASGCDYLILRTSWVFSSRGSNFLLSILRLASERKQLTVIDDQIGVPTWAVNVADITKNIILLSEKQRLTGKFISGIYNVVSSGATTWFDFSNKIISIASEFGLDSGFVVDQINPISSSEYQMPAKRPFYSVLSTEKIEKVCRISTIAWEHALECCMNVMKKTG